MLTPPRVVGSGSERADTVGPPTCLPKADAIEPGAITDAPLAALMMARDGGGSAMAIPPARDEIKNIVAEMLLRIYR
jgi:hypothetical protein